MKVIGLTGTIGSGKEEVKKIILENSCYKDVKLSDIIREEMKKSNADRKTLQDYGNELRKKFGPDILVKLAIKKNRGNFLVIDGIRNFSEVEFLRKKFGKNFKLIAVDAPIELRYERIRKRGREDDPKTLEEFLAADERNGGINEPEWGQQTKKCIDLADVLIYNDKTLRELRAQVLNALKTFF
jgi:dephospho-CoA kinase